MENNGKLEEEKIWKKIMGVKTFLNFNNFVWFNYDVHIEICLPISLSLHVNGQGWLKYIISIFIFLFKKFNLSTPLKLELNSVVDLSNPLKESSKTQKVHALQRKRAIRTGPPLENDKVYKN